MGKNFTSSENGNTQFSDEELARWGLQQEGGTNSPLGIVGSKEILNTSNSPKKKPLELQERIDKSIKTFDNTFLYPGKKSFEYSSALLKSVELSHQTLLTKEQAMMILNKECVVRPPTEKEKKYLEYWDAIYFDVVNILKEEDTDRRSTKTFDLMSILNNTLIDRPQELNVCNFTDLKAMNSILMDADMKTLSAWATMHKSAETKEDTRESTTLKTPFSKFRKIPYETTVWKN